MKEATSAQCDLMLLTITTAPTAGSSVAALHHFIVFIFVYLLLVPSTVCFGCLSGAYEVP